MISLLISFVAAKVIPVLLFVCIGIVVEQIARTVYRPSANNKAMNGVCIFFFQFCELTIGAALVLFLYRLIGKIPGTGFIHIRVSDCGILPLGVGLAFFNLMIYDFFYYWFHRMQHTSQWLWAEHELHHSDECMNVTTTWRHHWLEVPMHALFISAPMALCFTVPDPSIPVAAILARFISYFIHLNARIELGRFSQVITGPQHHRIHHSVMPQHLDKNFAAVLPLWDILFGTYYHPRKGEFPPTGLISGRVVYSAWEGFFMPFVTWANMLRQSREKIQSHKIENEA